MTLFGKILLVFNLLLAAGFVYLATQDWKGRQTINAAAVRHLLLVGGLPVGGEPGDPATMPTGPDAEVPFKIEMAGGFRTDTVSPKLLDTYFANVAPADTPLGKGTVASQVAEVKRVKAFIDDLLAKEDGQAAKAARLRGLLLAGAETYDERLAILRLAQEENVAELEKLLAARFAAVTEAPKPASAESQAKLGAEVEDAEQIKTKLEQIEQSRAVPQDQGERRAKIAHLLVHLSPDAAWQNRVRAVIGARRYVAAVAAQIDRFADMARSVEDLIIADQELYRADVRLQFERARRGTTLAAEQAKIRLNWQEQKRREDDFVAQRTTELNAIKAQLRKVKAEVDELLARQGTIEAALFAVQREVAVTLDEVYQLEERLAARERDLLGLPPKGN